MLKTIDPTDFAAALIRCPSVTPKDEGALDVLQNALSDLGFRCTRLPFEEDGTAPIDNLYARYGTTGPHFCFAGHTDVVPPGDEAVWSEPPFAGRVSDGKLFGRGAVDMKGSIACFVAAASRLLTADTDLPGSVSLLITGDEEGPAVNGTRKMLTWLTENGETIDHCLVGEPTNPADLGDMIKIGRRGNLTAYLTVHGIEGHVAYPHRADNPVHRLVAMLNALVTGFQDEPTEYFEASTLQIATVDVGNPAANVIPAMATATLNIRFNERHTLESLQAWVEQTCRAAAGEGARIDFHFNKGTNSFVTKPGAFVDLVHSAVEDLTGKTPVLSTSGGTSDARYIKDVCPVVEFGLVNQTMHKINEHTPVDDLNTLTSIYERVLKSYFERSW